MAAIAQTETAIEKTIAPIPRPIRVGTRGAPSAGTSGAIKACSPASPKRLDDTRVPAIMIPKTTVPVVMFAFALST